MLQHESPQCRRKRSIVPVFFQHPDQVRALDPSDELVGQVLQGPVVVEVEAERLLRERDDLGGQVVRLDHRPRGRDDRLLDECSSSRTFPGQS